MDPGREGRGRGTGPRAGADRAQGARHSLADRQGPPCGDGQWWVGSWNVGALNGWTGSGGARSRETGRGVTCLDNAPGARRIGPPCFTHSTAQRFCAAGYPTVLSVRLDIRVRENVLWNRGWSQIQAGGSDLGASADLSIFPDGAGVHLLRLRLARHRCREPLPRHPQAPEGAHGPCALSLFGHAVAIHTSFPFSVPVALVDSLAISRGGSQSSGKLTCKCILLPVSDQLPLDLGPSA